MITPYRINRRNAFKLGAATAAVPFTRRFCSAEPAQTLLHASFGAHGMAWSDIQSLTVSPYVKLVAVAEVDERRLTDVKKRFPEVRVYADGRELLDKEKKLDSVNVSTPDHMHAYFALRALERGLHVYCQKPLTRTVREARKLTEVAAAKGVVTQMGTQIHSHRHHRTVVQLIHGGAIGPVKEVHSWSGKDWGDRNPRPDRRDPVPAGLHWDLWLGGAAERPFIKDYYHPSVWRRRLDFGTGTFGDMACHILDPVFSSLELTAPTALRSTGPAPGPDSWALDVEVAFDFPGTARTAGPIKLTWYNGQRRPSAEIQAHIGRRKLSDQGTIYLGEKGVLYSPYIGPPVLLPEEKFRDVDLPKLESVDHYLQFVNACRATDKTTTPFSYAGPLTEAVLLGCLATRFPQTALTWNARTMAVGGSAVANNFVGAEYRRGWEV